MAEWAEYLRRHGGFYSFGSDNAISSDTIFNDTYLISLGSNVRIAGAWFAGHDGSINMLNKAYDLKLDSVAPIVVGDNVFIGRGVSVLPGARIGNNIIIGVGAVVSGHLPEGHVFAGVPAKPIRTIEEHVDRIKKQTESFPWRDLIEAREGGFDRAMEPELRRRRQRYFFHTE